MNYAVVRHGGKQYKVSEGDTLELEGTAGKKDEKVRFEDVLLLSYDNELNIGKPSVSGVDITGTVLENKKGDKIRVSKFKAKARYRKTIGFRPTLTVIKIDSFKKTIGAKKKPANKA